jgi:hypothetical protein
MPDLEWATAPRPRPAYGGDPRDPSDGRDSWPDGSSLAQSRDQTNHRVVTAEMGASEPLMAEDDTPPRDFSSYRSRLGTRRTELPRSPAPKHPVGLENSVRWFELRLRLKRCSDQQLFLSAFT